MKAYLAVFSARFRTMLQYRAAAAAGCATQVFWGLIRMMIFIAFYTQAAPGQPMTCAETVSYIWLGQACLLLAMFGSDGELREMIRSGTIAYELLRPLDLYRLWFWRITAARLAPLLLRLTPIMAIALLFGGLAPPASVASAAWWVTGMVAALLLGSAISALLTISLLWTVSGEGLNRLVPAVIWLLSGLIVPLPLFPDWAQPVLAFLPFRGMADTPFRLYLGLIPPDRALAAVAHQLAWTVVLALLGRWVLQRGLRRLVVQGG